MLSNLFKKNVHSVPANYFSVDSRTTTDLDFKLQLASLNLKLNARLKLELSKTHDKVNLDHVHAMQVFIRAMDVYFASGIPQIDPVTGVLMTISKLDTNRKCLVLVAVAKYRQYLRSILN